ncbi:hypothetical protein BRADI_2g14960v3 [Brachypodium distachyon]|nr:hypothetical protein BRADI_2g14960v3 [Brachypodium distachyon]
MKNESSRLDAELPTLHQHFKQPECSPTSATPDSQEFSMSYYKTNQTRPNDLVEMTTVDSLTDDVVDPCNLSHIPATNHILKMNSGVMANGDKGKKSPSTTFTANMKSPESDFIVNQRQHMPACPPLSGNVSANENNQNSGCHAMPSNGKPSPDYAFMRVSNGNMQTQPKVSLPPLGQQPKVLNKRESAAKGESNMPRAEKRADATSSNAETSISSAAAAMKEAMEYADARLKAAKELMERKGDSFRIRKKPSHHSNSRSVEIKAPIEAYTFEEKLPVKKPAKENNSENFMLDKHQQVSAVRSNHCDDTEKKALPLEKPQRTRQTWTVPCQTSSKVEKLGKWRSGEEFYELTEDDQKCPTDTATGEEDGCGRSKPVTKSSKGQKGRVEVTALDSDLERYEEVLDVKDSRDMGVKDIDQREDNTVPVEKEEDRMSTILEVPTEAMARKENDNSHFDGLVTTKGSHDDDGSVELPSISEISAAPDFIKDVPSSFSVAYSSEDHANDLRDLGNSNTRGKSVAGTSEEPKISELNEGHEGLEAACVDEMQYTSGSSNKLQELPEVANVGNVQASQIKSLISEELEGSYPTEAFPRVKNTAGLDDETYGREKFSFIGESYLHNENDKVFEVTCESLISEVAKVGNEVEVGPVTHSEKLVPGQEAEHPEEIDIASRNNNLVDHDVSTVLNVFEVASKLIKRDLDQEIQGSLGPSEVENRTEATDILVSDNKGKEAEDTPSENNEKTDTEEESAHGNQDDQTTTPSENNEKIDTEEESAHGNQHDQTTSASDVDKGQSDLGAQGSIAVDEMGTAICSGNEVTIESADDRPTRLTINSKDEPVPCPEMSPGMQHLPQNAESATSQTCNENISCVNKTKGGGKEAERELPAERSTTFEEEKSGIIKMGRKDPRESISKAEQKHDQPHLEKTGSVPNSVERPFPVYAEVPRKQAPAVQNTKDRGNINKTEKERENGKEASQRLEEAKQRAKLLEKQREDSERKEMEEQERERERKKDKLAVERATREAHERAFADAREKAEKMALERIAAARQRASAEARQKEERASAEARIKAERAAVERATAEARERAIEKAKAEKAAAEVRERRERYRSSSKDKSGNLDIRQDSQFHRAIASKVGETESALRHKARIERHQRTTERVSKALAEKNMRDLMAQREQAEKHRLSDFLDPEIKRWSNGKEGNLRALLSTLQYILGPDSGWQPVPLTDLITAVAVKKAYRKATLCVHPDKLQQRGATIRQKYICEKVFDLLKDAWNKFTSEER